MSTSRFSLAMNASTTTWNGALSLSNPDPSGKTSGRLSLFFKSAQGLNVPMLYRYLRDASAENIVDTFVMAFHIRDCRGGKGLRDLGRRALVWLFVNYPKEFEKVMHLIPEYGRWDDLLQFFPNVIDLSNSTYVQNNYNTVNTPTQPYLNDLKDIQSRVVDMYALQLTKDRNNMYDGKPCSLASKWSPTERDSWDRDHNTFETLANALHVTPRQLRVCFNTPLRSYINVVENFMCHGRWNHIDYSKVPGQAMKKLRKAFDRHDAVRFQEWVTNLSRTDSKKTKVNAATLHPHEIVRELLKCRDDVLEAQWRVLVEEVKKMGTLNDCVIVCDTSGSMTFNNSIPLYISLALGMIISEVVEGPFHNHVITFNSRPEFVTIRDGSVYDRLLQLKNIPWGGSTNLEATFQMILNRGKRYGLSNEDMPKKLFIISDMQFDQISQNRTNFEAVEEMYRSAGWYTRPQIVFWNVNGASTDYPITAGEHNTALVAGSSPSILNTLINTTDFTPLGVLKYALNSNRYNAIRECLT